MIRTDESLTRAVEEVTRAAARRYVGLVVGAFAGSRTAVHGAGSKMDGGGPPTGDTLFQIGSITKVFTALALAEAVVRSELTLDTPLARYLPEAPTSRSGAPITLAHLAAHTSGLPRLPKGMRRQALRHRLDPYREFTTADLLAALAAARPRHEPGTKVRYSNFGAALLGEALSRHAGLPYDGMIAERVAGPLRLCDTVVRPRPYQVDRRATGHSNRRRAVPDWDLGAMPGAGALHSTVNDLLTLLRAHLEPDTCALPEAVRLVQQPRATAHRWLRVGLGWHLSPVRGTQHSALWHNGGTGGFASYVALMPDAHVGVVVLTNTARPVDRVGIRLLQRLANPLE
jgi:serine-type D-Ala-D-Ala carboxypeptidase/endopeptidase